MPRATRLLGAVVIYKAEQPRACLPDRLLNLQQTSRTWLESCPLRFCRFWYLVAMSANISVSRGKSLRIPASNALKPSPSPQPSTGPSNIALFLTNIRLLDFDLRDDWPDITAVTFSTKDAQQNQKKRIQCVEWALYQLFAIWNPEETRDVRCRPFIDTYYRVLNIYGRN